MDRQLDLSLRGNRSGLRMFHREPLVRTIVEKVI